MTDKNGILAALDNGTAMYFGNNAKHCFGIAEALRKIIREFDANA